MINVKSLLAAILLSVGMLNVQAQLLLDENFSYGASTGDSLTNSAIGGANWKRHSGTGGPLLYIPTSLTFAGYGGSGIGGAITFAHATSSKEDANRPLSASVSSGTVYTSFLMNVTSSLGTTGDYAFHLNDTNGNLLVGNVFKARLFMKDGATAGTFKLGISKSGGVATAGFSTTDYNLNQTYLVVVKYIFNTGTTSDDSVYATIISGSIPTTEPVFAITPADNNSGDILKVKSVCIRQGNVGTGGATIDGMRVATNWTDLIGAPVASAAPAPVTGLTLTGLTKSSALISFTKNVAYDAAKMKVLVFIKKDTAIISGTPDMAAINYTAMAHIAMPGTGYQHDNAAFCVANGDTNQITVTGLLAGTTYHLLAYVVNTDDSVYSTKAIANGTSSATPAAVSAVTITSSSQTSAWIKWTKPASFDNNNSTVLVFAKATAAITGTPTLAKASIYTANSVFTSAPQSLGGDPTAGCVYNASGDSVLVTALTAGTTYYVSVFVGRNADSTYSAAATANGNTSAPLPPPMYDIAQINKVNTTTGVPDSLSVKVTVKGVVYGLNQRATGIQVVIRDTTGGITLFNSAKNFGYTTVAEGDELEASGSVATFRGLTQITLDTVIVKSTGKTLKTPTLVTKVEEVSENDLIRINKVKFITPPSGGNWPSSSTNISVTNELNDTIVIRVLSTFPIAGKPLPTTPTFNVIGLGVQFSTNSSAPFAFNGYQIFPRTEADIIGIPVIPADTLSPFNLVSPANNDTIVLTNTNLADTVILSWTASVNSNGIDTTTYTFIMDTVGEDFSNPRFEMMTGSNNVLPLTKSVILQMATLNGIASGQLFAGIWEAKAESKSLVRYSNSFRNLFILNNVTTGIGEQTRLDGISLYPNPARESVMIRGLIAHKDVVTVYGITGKTELTVTATETGISLPTHTLSVGIHFVKVQSGEAIVIKKLIIQ